MDTKTYFEITNTCTCFEDDESGDCWGDCWEFTLQLWSENVAPLFENLNDDCEWRIEGLPLWYGGVNGTVSTYDPAELLRSVTVNSEWHLKYAVDADNNRIDLYLSHHDAPTGGWFTVEVVG